jgi:hypothetical protein
MGELRQKLDEALGITTVSSSDAAAVALARAYADAIDAGGAEALKELGSKLLTTLDALGMTPLARMTVKRGTSGGLVADLGGSELEQRRAKRRARMHNAEGLDPAAGGAHT